MPGKQKQVVIAWHGDALCPSDLTGLRLEGRRQSILDVVCGVILVSCFEILNASVPQHHAGEIALRVEVGDDHLLAHRSKHPRKIEDGRSLRDAALMIEKVDYLAHERPFLTLPVNCDLAQCSEVGQLEVAMFQSSSLAKPRQIT